MGQRSMSSQFLQKARLGELDTLREIVQVVTPRNASVDLIDLLFNFITINGVPVLERSRHDLVSAAVAAARPTLCLRALWKIVNSSDRLKPDVKSALVQRIQDAGGDLFDWTRFCLQTGMLCISEDMLTQRPPSRLEQYLLQADLLTQLLQLDSGCFNALTSSCEFVQLFVELWTAKSEPQHGNQSSITYRMAFVGPSTICPILELASTVLSEEGSRDLLFSRFDSVKSCEAFCQAAVDRIRDDRENNTVPGWIQYFLALVAILTNLVRRSHLFRSQLTHLSYLTELCVATSRAMDVTPETKGTARDLCSGMMGIFALAMDRGSRQRLHRNWEHLHNGQFLQILFRAAAALEPEDRQVREHIISTVDSIGRATSYPKLFGGSTFGSPWPSLEAFKRYPTLLNAWKRLLFLQDRAREACRRLETRPSVFACDYQHCHRSVLKGHEMPKQCAGCSSVVYCSQKCQEHDWKDFHRNECPHANDLHSRLAHSKTIYDHDTRASHIALLEVIVSGMRSRDSAPSDHILTIDLDAAGDGSPEKVLVESLSDIRETCARHLPAYLQPRVVSLFEEYHGRNFPPNWRLIKGVFSPFTDNHKTIQLILLLKPVEDGHMGVYCIAQYQ
ncbi:hypothetical protein FA13DRAFT_1779180 [Coprinellus micaceus]|uniref:MYND-type domain-containing protein n=1 Tax=Coprinellus micaceus TaxID=71717 RepID=A0A4Y7SIT1_COPMI|nr:hypothetical protein FA13DRAFT_1779180 [Coprinellus micaceus]